MRDKGKDKCLEDFTFMFLKDLKINFKLQNATSKAIGNNFHFGMNPAENSSEYSIRQFVLRRTNK